MEPVIAPVKNAAYKAISILGKPKTKPKRKESFTSPKPIPLPRVIRYKIRKNAKEASAERNLFAYTPFAYTPRVESWKVEKNLRRGVYFM